ncbi:LCP family protein [Canibacter sp. lx-45]|uniref:LCP family protein n=1 Tax=Canibacter zhuwentaonis TaxID=2837491 RepID=UPI001BDDBA93|nr:LCP family protein [Canibacter zhuwentaonis]MBT1035838.1 LCP family protein [Canibacter zhuwentaonis]
MNLSAQLRLPLRYPNVSSAVFMTKRARWLVLLGFLIPGSAQILAGKRGLGRFGLGAMLLFVVLGLCALVFFLVDRALALTFFTNTWALLGLQIAMVFYGLVWLILGFDTLCLIRLNRVAVNWRPVIASLAVILTLAQVCAAAWTTSTIGAGRNLIDTLFANKAPVVAPVEGRYNILLLGADAAPDREGLRPDSISLISVDAKTGQSTIIGLPREMADVPFPQDSPMYTLHPNGFGVDGGCNTGRCWLNSLYAEAEYFNPELYPDASGRASSPGVEATKDAVSGVTGLKVQFYVLVNMDGFAKLIDALGGVQMHVKERIPIGGDASGYGVEGYIEPGVQQLNGYNALWYARSRYGSARGDYDRMERQHELQTAILKQMTPQNVLLRFQDILNSGEYLAETDIPSSMFGRFVDLAGKAKEHEPVRVELSPPAIDPEYPDFNEAQRLVREGVVRASVEG